MGVQALVLACNTASSVAVESLRQTYSIPIIAMEPAIKAAQAIAKGKIVVLATELTLKLPKFRNLMERYPQNLSAVPVYGLVELIERGITEGKEVTDCLHRALEGVTEGPASTLWFWAVHTIHLCGIAYGESWALKLRSSMAPWGRSVI